MSNISFGTGGFRAVIGEDFTKENVQKISQAISNIINRDNLVKTVCIGYDNRFMSEQYATWCSEVMAGNGINVELFTEAVTTPVVMYATKVNNYSYGIMITASHNPYIYNGLKVVISGGMDAGVEETKAIEQELNNMTEIKTMLISDPNNTYIKRTDYAERFVTSIVDLLEINDVSDIKVVFDAKHGSSIKEINMLANKINLKDYTIINSNRDAFFGFKQPCPSIDNIEELTKDVLASKADIGFALDSDGDRIAVIDELGNYIDNNYILAIMYYFLSKYCNKQGNSVKNVATSNLLNVITEKCGYKCIEVPVGFKYISRGIIDNDAIIGGESSGGLAITGHIWGKDSLLVIAMILKCMQVMNKKFSEIMQEVRSFANNYSKVIYDKQYTFSIEKKQEILNLLFKDKKLVELDYPVDEIIYKDYFKINYKNGNWVLVRFSGTEPLLRIYVEADSFAEIEQIFAKWEELLGL